MMAVNSEHPLSQQTTGNPNSQFKMQFVMALALDWYNFKCHLP
jgi:hypothetical protein